MVKIIREVPEARKRVTCRNCATLLEYTLSEVKERHGRDYSGGPDGCKWIDCPKCNDMVILESW